MAIDIQWDRLVTPNYSRNLLAGYQAGKEMRKENETQNALNMYAAGDAEGAYRALLPVDPSAAMALRKAGREERAYTAREKAQPLIAAGKYTEAAQGLAAEDPDYAKQLIAWAKTAREEEKALAQEKLEKTARALLPLRGLTPQEQAARWAQIAPSLGAKPEDIDFTQPGALEANINQAMEVKDIIAQANKDREFDALQADRAADNRRADAQLAVSRGNLAVSRSNSARGWAAHNERKRQGGYSAGAATGGAWEEF